MSDKPTALDIIEIPIELERYELFAAPTYRFNVDRREFLKLFGGGMVIVFTLKDAMALQETGGRGRQAGESGRPAPNQTPPKEIDAWLHIGTDGTDYFGRLAARVTPNMMVGLDLDRAVIGSTAKNFPGPQEKRLGGSVDVSYRFWGRYSLFAQYMISDVKNRQFRPGDDGLDHLVRLELTRSFR